MCSFRNCQELLSTPYIMAELEFAVIVHEHRLPLALRHMYLSGAMIVRVGDAVECLHTREIGNWRTPPESPRKNGHD